MVVQLIQNIIIISSSLILRVSFRNLGFSLGFALQQMFPVVLLPAPFELKSLCMRFFLQHYSPNFKFKMIDNM